MLQIEITGITPSGGLTLTENGNPNNGKSSAHKGEDVHWKVKNDSGVKAINSFSMKPIGGNVDIFSPNNPSPQNAQKTHWKGKVNNSVRVGDVYIYNIEWIKDGETNVRTFDPIMSIKPRAAISLTNLAFIAIPVLGIFSYMLYRLLKSK